MKEGEGGCRSSDTEQLWGSVGSLAVIAIVYNVSTGK